MGISCGADRAAGVGKEISGADGLKYQVSEGVGVLRGDVKDACILRCEDCPPGRVCLRAEGAGGEELLNEPGTWKLLERVQGLAQQYGLSLLPEIHAAYEEKIYEKIAEKGYMTYDFFLPGLLIDALERADGATLAAWAEELQERKSVPSICWAAMTAFRCSI